MSGRTLLFLQLASLLHRTSKAAEIRVGLNQPMASPSGDTEFRMKMPVVLIGMAVVALAVAVLIQLVGRASDPENVGKKLSTIVVDYGNGVCYFPKTRAGFGNSLSQFVLTHQGTRVLSIAADGSGSYGRTVGYFVVISPAGGCE